MVLVFLSLFYLQSDGDTLWYIQSFSITRFVYART